MSKRRELAVENGVMGGAGWLSRRGLIGGALGLSAVAGRAIGAEAERGPFSLKSAASVPVGCCVSTAQLNDPAFAGLLTRNFSQITPEWEMKMGAILRNDGGLRFDAPDALAAFARRNRLRLHAHNLIWYKQSPPAFERFDGNRKAFADAYRSYILTVAGRYRGQAAGWDVVNEPIAPDGNGLRDCLWSRNLGMEDYILLALEHAAEADPQAVLFINEYDLERKPEKRATFLRLIERLLKRGARLGGIGTQTHIEIDLPDGAAARCIRELSTFGLPIHVSETDISFGRRAVDVRSVAQRLDLQAKKAAEVAGAFMDLPARQRYAFSLWGLRDRDSWLLQPSAATVAGNQPLAFDDGGQPKPMARALAAALRAPRAGGG